MKKSIFYWAFLAVAGMSLTACSSGDDNIADNTTPVTPDSQNKKVILTGTIGVGGDETRAVDDAGVTSWEVDNEIAINYQKADNSYARTYCRITQVSSDKHFASFEATLDNPKNDGFIGFAYPNDKVKPTTTPRPNSAYDFEFNYNAYSSQEGTTATITSSGLDYACTESGGEVKMAVDGSTAKLKGNALLKNQFSMYKFTLVKEGETSTNVPATKLKIWVGESTFTSSPAYTITPANSNAYSVFYVALKPKDTGDKVKIVASFDGKDAAKKLDATAAAAISSTDYGKFIGTDASDGNQAYLYSSSNSAKVCEHTYGTNTKFVKGKFYSSNLTVKDLTPTAVIAYTGNVANYCTKFIALALEDAIPTTVTLTQAQSEIGSSTWVSDHKLKIGNQTYDQFQGETTEGVKGKYDEVYSNQYNNATHYMTTNESSQSRTASQLTGWRIPSVTDFRYIFSQLKDDSNNYVIDQSKISPTSPAGIGDHNVKYYDGATHYAYGTGTTLLSTYINKLCGTPNPEDPNKLDDQFYWLSSQLLDWTDSDNDETIDDGELSVVAGKAWRFSFAADYFVWNGDSDTSRARLVFAY